MATVHDVAAYVLQEHGPTTAMKLEKLVYYAQAWALVWDKAPLFGERIEAWTNGPVVRELFEKHRGLPQVGHWPGNPAALGAAQKETIRAVVAFYGGRDPEWLSELTHREGPWRQARSGKPHGARSTRYITHDAMARYYGTLGIKKKHLPEALERGLDLLVGLAPDEVDRLTEDMGPGVNEAIAWLETGAGRPYDPSG